MKQFTYRIKIPQGIHVLPASFLAEKAGKYESFITLSKNEEEVNLANAVKLIRLAVKYYDSVIITIDGPDENVAYEDLIHYFNEKL